MHFKTMFFGDKKLGILFSGGSEILNPFPTNVPRWIRNSRSSPASLGGSEILNPFVCHCRGSEILSPLFCHCRGSEVLNLWGIRNSESFPVLLLIF